MKDAEIWWGRGGEWKRTYSEWLRISWKSPKNTDRFFGRDIDPFNRRGRSPACWFVLNNFFLFYFLSSIDSIYPFAYELYLSSRAPSLTFFLFLSLSLSLSLTLALSFSLSPFFLTYHFQFSTISLFILLFRFFLCCSLSFGFFFSLSLPPSLSLSFFLLIPS